jgi:SAM-dependent methyltransferase
VVSSIWIGRDAIALTERLFDGGSYLGIDINREQIDWCTANITSRYPNFRFEYWDVREQWYNPSGVLNLAECRIPVLPSSVDRVILQSVFSHLLPDDLKHYLNEFRRILKPQGSVLATCFIMTDEIFANQKEGDTIFFHDAGGGVFVRDRSHPTMGVAYKDKVLRALISECGLQEAIPPLNGSWGGVNPKPWQDVAFLKRQS